jgi:cytochrome c
MTKGDKNAAANLEKKVRAGGGVWGPVPMPPNLKEKISDDDAKKLVAWILTL